MRRFGIELEMVAPVTARGDALNHAAALINGLNVQCRTASYTGRAYNVWQCKSDSSISPHDRSVEVVSAIMPARPDSYETVTRVATRLDGEGYGINRTCGFHVHVDVADLTTQERMLVVLRYAHMQGEINAMLPPSRRSNNYCAPLRDRASLESAIDRNSTSWRAGQGRASESVNTAFLHDGANARLEFRQAAGTCNAAKVVGWITFLQEFIDEIVRRARAAGRIGNGAPAAPSPFGPRPTPVRTNPLAAMPRMRPGTDMHNALMQLCRTGVVTTAWAVENGIQANVLRRIIVGFRRHGAGIRTVSGVPNMPEYHLSAVAAPCQPRDVFAPVLAPAAVAPVAPVAPVPVAPVAPPVASVTAAVLVAYPLESGLSPATVAWCRDRRDTFNAELNA
jgi:Putative amidoligase enzyme